MEKYKNLREIVKESLDARLEKLVIEYEGEQNLHITIDYTDQGEFHYIYELVFDKNRSKVEFISHICLNSVHEVSLKRNSVLEENIVGYLIRK